MKFHFIHEPIIPVGRNGRSIKKKEIGCSRSLLRNSEVKKERCEKREGGFKPNTRETSPQKLLAGHQGGSNQEAGGTQRESWLLFRARG